MTNATTRTARPATEKQINLIKKVMGEKILPAQLHEDLTQALEYGALSTRDASRFIDALFALPRKQRAPKADVAEGWYRREASEGNPDIAVVKFNRAKTNKYAMMLEIREDRGEWIYERGLIGIIGREGSGWKQMTLEEAAAFGKLYGWCMVCGRTLTDPKSIERGIGPICAGKF